MLKHTLRNGVLLAAVLVVFTFAPGAYAQKCGPMDVVFIVDNSGSMANVISEIQTQVVKIADAVQTASGGDYQFGLLGMPANDINVYLDMSANNRTALDNAVKMMGTSGSFGLGIAYDEALDTVLNHLGPRTGSLGAQTGSFTGVWRPNAVKIIMVITDTGPQGFDSSLGNHGEHTHQMALLAASLGIHITGIFVPTGGGTDPAIDVPIMQDMTTTSQGLFKQTKPDASDLADVIVDIVNACGGAATSGGITSLKIEPDELVLTNGETGKVYITNYAPGSAQAPSVYSTQFDETAGFTTSFTPVKTPKEPGTDETILNVTAGPDTMQGTHLVAVKAEAPGLVDNYVIVHVIVDCRPPYFLSAGNPQNANIAAGETTTLKATASGDGPMHYQWYRGHSGITTFPISGATTTQLTTDALKGAGEYWVRASNACGSRDSMTATVTQK